MNPVSPILFEHETAPFDWSDRELHAVARLNESSGVNIVHLLNVPGQRVIRTTQYVGMVRLGTHTIQILPKLYNAHGTTPPAQQAARNLLYMLVQTADLPVRDTELAAMMQQHSDWFEALTALFTNRLVELWQRGPQRTYQSVSDELPLLKGKLRIADQLRRPDRPHRLAVLYDEFTVDQPLNQLLRCAVEVLWQLTLHPANRRWLETLRDWMEPITLLPPTVALALTLPPLNRLNQHYAPLLNLARLLLRQAAPQLSHGRLETFSFVFDMNQLFERFLTSVIKRHRTAILPSSLAHTQLFAQANSNQLSLAQRDDGLEAFRLKPDLLFRSEDAIPLLVDMKYKLLDTSTARLDVAPGDFYQMLAYSHRYQCPRVMLLYPQTAAMTNPVQHSFQVHKSTTRILVRTVDLRPDFTHVATRQRLLDELTEGFANAV